jgi:murein DD-endopeptidase MepM/ murein hydrolase activator NlpD
MASGAVRLLAAGVGMLLGGSLLPASASAEPGGGLSGAGDGETLLASRNIAMPLPGVEAAGLHDTFLDGRPGRRHEAIDIAAARGTKVFAVDDGTLAKLFTSIPGGLTVYQFDPQRQLAYYYAHLDRYAAGLREGMPLHRCDLLGYVGTSGNAPPQAPHLHFAVFRLASPPQWWQGTPVNPYAALKSATAAASSGSSAAKTRACR